MNQQIEDDERCALCSALPEDILMLECNHDICVDCALRGYKNKNQIQGFFVCNICQKKTILDKETIKFLNAATEQKQAKQELKSQKKERSEKPKIPKHPKAQRRVCPQHRQQLIYYCFDCETEDICSECILEQKHTNHNVSTLKKAAAKFKDILVSSLKEKQLFQTKLHNHFTSLKELSVNLKNHIESKKKEIKSYYQGLKTVIDNHYEKIIKDFFEFSSRTQNTLVGEMSRCANNIENLKEEIEQLGVGISSSEELQLLKKFKVKDTNITIQKIEVGFPEFEHTDISSQLARKLDLSCIHIPNIKNGIAKSDRNKKAQQNRYQEQHYQKQHYAQQNSLHVPHYPGQTRIKNAMNLSSRSSKNSYIQTPLKPEMSRSINTASELINRIQSRQRSFD